MFDRSEISPEMWLLINPLTRLWLCV